MKKKCPTDMKIYENVRTENNLVLNLYYQDTNNCTHPLHMQSLASDLRNIAHIFLLNTKPIG